MSSKKQQQIDWRREQTFEYFAKGYNLSEISRVLHVDRSVTCRDMVFIRDKAKSHLKSYLEEKLPAEFEASLLGLTAILRESWNISQSTEDNREKISALSLCKDAYTSRIDLLTNMNVVDDVITFIGNRKSKLLSQGNERQKEGQIQEEQTTEQQQQQGENSSSTAALTAVDDNEEVTTDREVF